MDPITKAIINIVMTIASVAYQAVQQKKMKKAMDARKGFEFTVSGESAPLPVVYGKQIIGGVATSRKVTTGFEETSSTEDTLFAEGLPTTAVIGTKSEFLHVQYALCQGGIEGVQGMLVNGLAYDDAEAGFKHRIRIFNDTIASSPSSHTAMGFPATNLFTGAASSTATFRLNRDDYNYNGEPSIQFLMKGRKVRAVELNTGVYSLSTSWVYSNNPVLVLIDYLTNAEFGRGLPVAKMDLESFYNAAAVCDTVVTSGRAIGGLVNGATTTRDLPLYECNITLDTEATIRENIERILETMGFAEMMWSPEGRYKLTLDYPTSLAETNALIPSTHVFTDDNILRDEVSLSWLSASQRSNQATVNFMNEHEDFKEDSMTWPVFGSATYNTYLTEDNQQPLRKNLQVAGITDPYHALARAEQEVRKSRQLFTIEFTADKQALSVEIGDLIKLTLFTSGLTDEIFKVNAMEVRADMSVKISAYSFSHEMLAWNVNDDIAYATRPVFDFVIEPVTSLVYTAGKPSGDHTALAELTWTAPIDGSVKSVVYYNEGDPVDGLSGTESVTNGTFTGTGNVVNWTLDGTAVNNNGVDVFDVTAGAATNVVATQVIALTVGNTYQLSFERVTGTGSCSVSAASAGLPTLYSGTVGVETRTFVATAASATLLINSASGGLVTILDNISVQEVVDTWTGDLAILGETSSDNFFIYPRSDWTDGENVKFTVRAQTPLGRLSTGVSVTNTVVKTPPAPTSFSAVEALYQTNKASGVKARATLSFSEPVGGVEPKDYKVEYYRDEDGSTYELLGYTVGQTYVFNDIRAGNYHFKITPISWFDDEGTPLVGTKEILGLSAIPTDPAGLVGKVSDTGILLTWTKPVDLDVLSGGHTQVRYVRNDVISPTWATAQVIVDRIGGTTTTATLPLASGYYLIKHFDSSGNASAGSQQYLNAFAGPDFNAITTLTEDPTFAGTKTNCTVVGSNLELDAAVTSMTYVFNNSIDLGSVESIRIIPSLTALITDGASTVADYTLVSGVTRFSGPIVDGAVNFEVRHTDDDPAGTPTWSDWETFTVGNYRHRGFEFRLTAVVGSSTYTIVVSELSLVADKEDTTKRGSSTSSASADTTVTFATQFYGGIGSTDVPYVGVNTVGGSADDTVNIVSTSATTFVYSVYNAGARVARTVNWAAVGQ